MFRPSATRPFPTFMGLVALLAFLAEGCSDGKTVVEYSVPKTETEAPAEDPASETGPEEAAIAWDAPEGWRETKGSQMRMASFSVSTDAGEVDISLVRLGGAAGGMLANVNRWLGQIAMRPIESEELAGLLDERRTEQGDRYFLVELNNPDIERSIYGGIYQRRGYTLFAKLVARTPAAQQAADDFAAFCDSVRFETERVASSESTPAPYDS